tara:strand:- start:489 stop:1151 length:663 start_codon:yes stop_codon:yes gene_type:complete
MAGLTVSTLPTIEPLSESEIRAYCRVQDDTDLDVLLMMGKTARMFCEEFTSRTLLTQTLELFLDATEDMNNPLWEGMRTGPYINYYKNYITLPKGPVQSVNSVHTFNDADTSTLMAASRYYVDIAREPARITLRTGETFPTALRVANSIKVVYKVGYSSVSLIPEPLKIGMLMHVAYMYDQRGDMKDYQQTQAMPPMIQKLYAPYVIHGGLGSSTLMATG